MCTNKNNNSYRFTPEQIDRVVKEIHKVYPDLDISDATLYLQENGLSTDIKKYDNGDIVFPIALRFYKEEF